MRILIDAVFFLYALLNCVFLVCCKRSDFMMKMNSSGARMLQGATLSMESRKTVYCDGSGCSDSLEMHNDYPGSAVQILLKLQHEGVDGVRNNISIDIESPDNIVICGSSDTPLLYTYSLQSLGHVAKVAAGQPGHTTCSSSTANKITVATGSYAGGSAHILWIPLQIVLPDAIGTNKDFTASVPKTTSGSTTATLSNPITLKALQGDATTEYFVHAAVDPVTKAHLPNILIHGSGNMVQSVLSVRWSAAMVVGKEITLNGPSGLEVCSSSGDVVSTWAYKTNHANVVVAGESGSNTSLTCDSATRNQVKVAISSGFGTSVHTIRVAVQYYVPTTTPSPTNKWVASSNADGVSTTADLDDALVVKPLLTDVTADRHGSNNGYFVGEKSQIRVEFKPTANSSSNTSGRLRVISFDLKYGSMELSGAGCQNVAALQRSSISSDHLNLIVHNFQLVANSECTLDLYYTEHLRGHPRGIGIHLATCDGVCEFAQMDNDENVVAQYYNAVGPPVAGAFSVDVSMKPGHVNFADEDSKWVLRFTGVDFTVPKDAYMFIKFPSDSSSIKAEANSISGGWIDNSQTSPVKVNTELVATTQGTAEIDIAVSNPSTFAAGQKFEIYASGDASDTIETGIANKRFYNYQSVMVPCTLR